MKNTLTSLLTLSALSLLSYPAFSQVKEKEEKTLLTVDCTSDKQKTCIDAAITPIVATFKSCAEGRLSDTIKLEAFADKKFTSTPLSDVEKQQRKDWIANISKNCDVTVNTPYDPTEHSSWVN